MPRRFTWALRTKNPKPPRLPIDPPTAAAVSSHGGKAEAGAEADPEGVPGVAPGATVRGAAIRGGARWYPLDENENRDIIAGKSDVPSSPPSLGKPKSHSIVD